jgi:hypothetical protein
MAAPKTYALSVGIEAGFILGAQAELGVVRFPDGTFDIFYVGGFGAVFGFSAEGNFGWTGEGAIGPGPVNYNELPGMTRDQFYGWGLSLDS